MHRSTQCWKSLLYAQVAKLRLHYLSQRPQPVVFPSMVSWRVVTLPSSPHNLIKKLLKLLYVYLSEQLSCLIVWKMKSSSFSGLPALVAVFTNKGDYSTTCCGSITRMQTSNPRCTGAPQSLTKHTHTESTRARRATHNFRFNCTQPRVLPIRMFAHAPHLC